MKFVNLHTHVPGSGPDILVVENLYWDQAPGGISRFYSAGLHPWYLPADNLQPALDWLQDQASKPETLFIGETGLDKVCPTPWSLQTEAFAACLRVADSVGKPLVIHCVKAFDEVLRTLKTARPHQPAVFHGFDKHPQTARQILEAGCYLSFGAALFRVGSHAAEALRQTPADRLFLETDDKDLDIRTVYARAAELRSDDLEILKMQVWENLQILTGSLLLPD